MDMNEQFLAPYFPDGALQQMQTEMINMGWCPSGNCFNYRGGVFTTYSRWRHNPITPYEFRTVGLTNEFYVKLWQSGLFTPEQIMLMQNKRIQDIAFDNRGNSLWSNDGVMTITSQVSEKVFRFNGHKDPPYSPILSTPAT